MIWLDLDDGTEIEVDFTKVDVLEKYMNEGRYVERLILPDYENMFTLKHLKDPTDLLAIKKYDRILENIDEDDNMLLLSAYQANYNDLTFDNIEQKLEEIKNWILFDTLDNDINKENAYEYILNYYGVPVEAYDFIDFDKMVEKALEDNIVKESNINQKDYLIEKK